MFSLQDHHFMQRAFHLAKSAAEQNEVPVGAVLVLNDIIVGEGFNSPISHKDPTAHAEILALRQGGKTLNNYRLINTTLYITLEPCLMCVGAITQARVKKVIFGAFDSRLGATHVLFNNNFHTALNHQVNYQGGLLQEKCRELLREFFAVRR